MTHGHFMPRSDSSCHRWRYSSPCSEAARGQTVVKTWPSPGFLQVSSFAWDILGLRWYVYFALVVGFTSPKQIQNLFFLLRFGRSISNPRFIAHGKSACPGFGGSRDCSGLSIGQCSYHVGFGLESGLSSGFSICPLAC